MNQNLVYFASAVVGALLSVAINQLPQVPDAIKPWFWIPVIGLTLLGGWLVIQSQAGAGNQTSASRNKLKGKGNKVRGRMGAKVDRNRLDGEDNEISIDDGTTGSGRNP
jgi:hypothetical protein